jgi:hypothetical protein
LDKHSEVTTPAHRADFSFRSLDIHQGRDHAEHLSEDKEKDAQRSERADCEDPQDNSLRIQFPKFYA